MPRDIVQKITLIDETKRGLDSISRNLGGLKGVLASIGTAVTAGAFGRLTKDALDSADEIQKLSQRLGASTEALSQYRLVADLTGVSFRTLTTGWQRMTRRIAEAANGTGEARNALKELGLEATALNELKPEQQFEILADAIMNVGSSSDQVRLAMKLFDSEGVALLQTMQGGSEAIRGMREEADRLGLTLSQETADGAAQANDAMTKFGASTKALGIVLARYLAPAITAIVNWLQVNLPSAVQVAVDAFYKLQEFTLKASSKITYGLSYLSASFARAAETIGADQLGRAFQKSAEDYFAMSSNADAAAIRIGKLVDANIGLKTSLEVGITFNQLYNAELVKGISKTEASTTARKKLAAATKEQVDPVEQYLSSLQREVDILGLTNSELREYELRKLNATQADIDRALALQDQIEIYEAISEVEKENQRIMERSAELMNEQADSMKEVKKASEELGPIISDAFGDALVEGKKFSDVLKGLEQDLIRVFTRMFITRPLTDFIGGFDIGSFFGLPGRAVGGPVASGSPYIVGENGPEVFVPSTNGRIEQPQGGVINVIVNGVQDAASFMRNKDQIARAAGAALRRAQATV